MHDGSAQLAISFAGNDEGRNTGSASAVTLRGGRLFGVLLFVDGAQVATRVLAVLGQGERVALVDCAARAGVAAMNFCIVQHQPRKRRQISTDELSTPSTGLGEGKVRIDSVSPSTLKRRTSTVPVQAWFHEVSM